MPCSYWLLIGYFLKQSQILSEFLKLFAQGFCFEKKKLSEAFAILSCTWRVLFAHFNPQGSMVMSRTMMTAFIVLPIISIYRVCWMTWGFLWHVSQSLWWPHLLFFRRDFHKTKCYFLCNPTIKKVRCLPKSILSDSFVVKGAELSYDCNTDDYKFVVFGHNSASHEPKAEIYSLRNDCWRDISFDRGDMFDYVKHASWYDDPDPNQYSTEQFFIGRCIMAASTL